jgi:hypothetical protein
MTIRNRWQWVAAFVSTFFIASVIASEAAANSTDFTPYLIASAQDAVLASATEETGHDPTDRVEITGGTANDGQPTDTAGLPQWVPRKRGAPAARVGGATRGVSADLEVRAMVPRFDDAALTLMAQPTFYWHISAPSEHRVNFTLIDPESVDPIIDVVLDGPFDTGMQAVRLADYGMRLEAEHTYHWFVALMPDPGRRSADMVAGGAVRRLAPEPELDRRLADGHDAARADRLAEAGIWYDALDALEGEIATRPTDATALARRSALLEQAGLAISK